MRSAQRLAVIITALPLEREAVLKHLRDVTEEPPLKGSIYRRGVFDERCEPWDVVVAEIGAGNVGAAAEALRVITQYSPQVALFVGVAGAIKDLKHGDVVAATRVYGYEAGKEGKAGFQPRPVLERPSYALERRARHEAGEADWRQRIKDPGCSSATSSVVPNAKVAPIAAGEKIVASNRSLTYKFLVDHCSDAVAVEMEGYGFLLGVHMSFPTQGIVIRGISDLVDDKDKENDDTWQPIAASHAAAFAFQVLAKLELVELDATAHSTKRTTPNLKARNRFFVGRDRLLEELRQSFLEPATCGRVNVQVLNGLGGVGKTQVALEYTYRHLTDYAHVFWMNADTELSLSAGFTEIARLLALPLSDRNQAGAVEAARRWLQGAESWLLVFDNADDPARLKPFLVANERGHVLVTSRASVFDVLGVSEPRLVGSLSPKDAVRFLLQRTGRTGTQGEELAAVERIAEELGGLPLALEQAAAYISSRQSSFSGYLAAYAARRLQVLERCRPVSGEYPATVATTWSLNIEAVGAESLAAAEVLEYSAVLYADSIPYELLVRGSEELGGEIAVALRNFYEHYDETLVDELLLPLTRYSLIEKFPMERTYSMHRLMQEVVRSDLTPAQVSARRRALIRALEFVFPMVSFETRYFCSRLITHAVTALGGAEDWELENEVAGTLLHRSAHFLEESGNYLLSASICQKAIEVREKVLGPEHADLGTTINNLGLVLYKLGDFAQSEAVLRKALAVRIKAHGESHPEVAQTWNNLGLALIELGKLDEGEACHGRVQDILRDAGDEYEDRRATCLNNLALLMHRRGRCDEADNLMRQVLEIRERLLGPWHPDVALVLYNLAVFLQERGGIETGLALIRRALTIQKATIGGAHPAFAKSLLVLGNVLCDRKQYTKALVAYNQAGNVIAAALGGTHPEIATVYVNLGHCYFQQGHDETAIKYQYLAVRLLEATVGPDHIDTATALSNLAYCYLRRRNAGIAKSLYQRVLAIRRRVFGPVHSDVAVALANLAFIEERIGDPEEANRLYRETDAVYAALGYPPIQDCQTFLTNFAAFLRSTGRRDEAEVIAARLASMSPPR